MTQLRTHLFKLKLRVLLGAGAEVRLLGRSCAIVVTKKDAITLIATNEALYPLQLGLKGE